jgi:hypothetical protein
MYRARLFAQRTLPLLLALALLAGCGGDPAAPKPSVTGTWAGTATGASGNPSTFTLTLAHNAATDAISGSGVFSQGGPATLALTVTGTYARPTVSLTMTATGFQAMNITGTAAATTITGTVNGSGFSNTAITLNKQ